MIALLSAQTYSATIPPDVLEAIEANYPNGLPKYITPEEQQWLDEHPEIASIKTTSIGSEITAAPSGVVWTPGEYEELDGVLIAWEGYTAILTEFAVEVSQSDTNAKVYVVVDNTSERSSVTSTLTSAGANMSNVEFLVRITDTVWMRDYGPSYIHEDGNPAIIDHIYNRPRPNDDAFPSWIRTSPVPFAQDEPLYLMDLEHGGGVDRTGSQILAPIGFNNGIQTIAADSDCDFDAGNFLQQVGRPESQPYSENSYNLSIYLL